jgi:hypothetical protein
MNCSVIASRRKFLLSVFRGGQLILLWHFRWISAFSGPRFEWWRCGLPRIHDSGLPIAAHLKWELIAGVPEEINFERIDFITEASVITSWPRKRLWLRWQFCGRISDRTLRECQNLWSSLTVSLTNIVSMFDLDWQCRSGFFLPLADRSSNGFLRLSFIARSIMRIHPTFSFFHLIFITFISAHHEASFISSQSIVRLSR